MQIVESSTANPTARALRVLQLIQANPGIGAEELARRLETTDRAVRRYVATLRDAGVPVDARRGHGGGYRLGHTIKPPPLMFTGSEVLGLVMAVLDGHHAAADPDDPVGSALGKLIATLPTQTAQQAATMRQLTRAAPDRRAARPDPTATSQLVDAVANRRRVRIAYTTGTGTALDTRIDPWAVVVRHGRWYLLGHNHDADEARAYRIDRVDRVTILNADAHAPDDLNPIAWLEAHLGTGRKYPTRVRFDAPIDAVAPWITPPMGQLEGVDGGVRCELSGSTDNPTMYACEWLAAIPHPFHVIDGPELHRAVSDLGHRMLAAAHHAGG